MAETAYDPYAQSDIGSRALGGEYIDSMNFYWFDPVTETTGSTTEGWSRVPDSVKPYTYINPTNRNNARNKFYEMGGSFGSPVGSDGSSGGGGILSGLNYARSIAGGENVPSMIAPGMSYSMDQPMGYTAPGASRIDSNRLGEQLPPGVDNGIDMSRFFPNREDQLKTLQSIFGPEVQYATSMTGADLGLPMGGGTPMPAGVLFDESSVRQMPEVRPQTVSPLGSLDTTYLSDIDFSGLLGTPSPQVDFPVAPPEVVANQPVYQDPILNMTDQNYFPVTGEDLGITATDMLPQSSPPSLGASLFDNVNIIPEAPEPMPLVDTSVLTPESNVDMNALQDIIDNLGLLNESQGIPVIPQIQSPVMPLLDVNPQIDFPIVQNTRNVSSDIRSLLSNSPINFDAVRNYGR